MSTTPILAAVRVHLVDPSAFTPPYDHALAGALAARGVEVSLITSRFGYGETPGASGYTVHERFYRWAPGRPGSAVRRAAKLLQHVPDMLAERRAAGTGADLVHFQWLDVQLIDGGLLPGVPTVLTAHDVLPREPRTGQRRAQSRLYHRVDAVVVHTAHGAQRLVDELGVDPQAVNVIPHAAFTGLREVGGVLPPELAAVDDDRPVALFFGLLRPYKGLDVLLAAWEGIGDAQLWVVGMPRMDVAALRAAAPDGVRFVERFVSDAEAVGVLRRADLVVLPYREIEQSGVLASALGLGRPLLLSDVGGFPEVARAGAARSVPAGDASALHDELAQLLGDAARRGELSAAATTLADGAWSWDAVAQAHVDLYERVLKR
jgi:glycosyltransferase involved in cell wall biosynthesis